MSHEKEDLDRLVDVLSDYECGHLLTAVSETATGERFWEREISTVYNEYVKMRSFNTGSDPSSAIPSAPMGDEGIFTPIPIVKSYPDAERVPLPAPSRLTAPLGDTLLGRRSRREYTGDAISVDDLSTLLHHTCGRTGFTAGYGYDRLPLRTFPSCGSLQVPEIYLSVQAVDGIPGGIYHYHFIDHALERLTSGAYGPGLRLFALGQPFVEDASVVFMITGCYERLRWKYGERAYRYMCIDVGFLGENLYLAGEALGLGVCAIAGFLDDAVEHLLGIDGRDEIILLLTTVGVVAGSTGTVR